jgi:hypothetical protein
LRQLTSQGTYDFRGVEYDPSDEDLSFDDLTDELDSIFEFKEEDGIAYSRRMPLEAYFNVTHSFNRTHHLSAMYHLRSWNGEAFHDLGFSYQAKLGRTFHLVLGYNMINGTWNNFSSGFALNMGGFQWHLMSDNAYGLMYPGRTHTVNIRTGFSFCFGRKRLEDRLAKFESEIPIIQPAPTETNESAKPADGNN